MHAGSTGIDTRILQHHDFYYPFFFLSLLLFLVFFLIAFLFFSAYKTRGMCYDITATQLSTRTKILVAQSPSPVAEDGEDHDLGVV